MKRLVKNFEIKKQILSLLLLSVILPHSNQVHCQFISDSPVEHNKLKLFELSETGKLNEGKPSQSITTYTSETTTVEIAAHMGTISRYLPIRSGGPCSYSQSLFFQDEINVSGKQITSVYYHVNSADYYKEKIEVYMGHSDSLRLRAYIDAKTNLTRVFHGEYEVLPGDQWIELKLDYPFEYNNIQNLVIAVIDNQKNTLPLYSSYFYEHYTGAGLLGPQLTAATSVSGPITAENPLFEGRGQPFRPDIRLEFNDIPKKPILMVQSTLLDVPYYDDLGEYPTKEQIESSIKILNKGNTAATITSVSFSSADFVYSGGTITIEPGESTDIEFLYTPSLAGEYIDTIKWTTDVPVVGDSMYFLKSTIYKRGNLYEGFEMVPAEFPGLFWEVTGIETPWERNTNWYINPGNYPNSWAYDRFSLVQAWVSSYIDTLITPALDIKTGDSLTFYAYAGASSSDSLPVVYSSDKENWNTLSNIALKRPDLGSNDPKAKWTRYKINFDGISGKIWVGFVTKDCVVHLDKVEGPALYLENDDLLISRIEGNNALTAGVENLLNVGVINYGNLSNSDYVVKLMQVGNPDIELAEVTGTELISVEENVIPINWIPTTEGDYQIYARVVPTNTDPQPGNNFSDTLDVTVYSNTTLSKTLGEKTGQTGFIYPINFNFNSSLGQGIYFADELQLGNCVINEISLSMQMVEDLPYQEITVWMGETEKTSLDGGLISSNLLTQVFHSDSVKFYNGDFEWRIVFDQPYHYQGGNLVLMIHKPFTSEYYSGHNQFNTSFNPEHNVTRSITFVDRSTNINPEFPPPADLPWNDETPYWQMFFNYFANIKFSVDVDGLGNIQGTVRDYNGQPIKDVLVSIEGTYFRTITNSNGTYELPNLNPGEQNLIASRFGYYNQEAIVTIPNNFYQIKDFTLSERAKYSISGTVVDHNLIPVPDVAITITGYEDIEIMTLADGTFNDSIWDLNSYKLEVNKDGYLPYKNSFIVNGTNIDLSEIVLQEIPLHPHIVLANDVGDVVELSWNKPEPSLEHEFRFDSDIPDGKLGFTTSDVSHIGTVFRYSALIDSVSFYFDSAKATDLAKVIILGLDNIGRPEPSKVLHISDTFRIEKNAWNGYKLEVPVYASNGFYIGISAQGYLGIGTAEPTAQYPFKAETFFTTYNADSTLITFYKPFELERHMKTLMLRANGYNYGESDLLYGKNSFTDSFPEPETIENDNTDIGQYSLDSYTIYRFTKDDINNPDNWALIASGITDTTYIDNSWNTALKGVYHYAVEANYDSGKNSFRMKSGRIGKNMTSDVSVTLNLPENYVLPGTRVKLISCDHLEDEIVEYATENNTILFSKVWNGNYYLQAYHPNASLYRELVTLENSTESFTIEFESAFPKPENLVIEKMQPGSVKLSWEEPLVMEKILDDNTAESGFFFLPGQIGEFGNFYNDSVSIQIKSVKVYGRNHSWSQRDMKNTIKIYNSEKQLLTESEPFELPANRWIDIPVPAVKVTGSYYITIAWNDIFRPSRVLALDITGEIGRTHKPAVVVDYRNHFEEFGSVGGFTGAFLIRPQYYHIDSTISTLAIGPTTQSVIVDEIEGYSFEAFNETADTYSSNEGITYKVFSNDELAKDKVYQNSAILENIKQGSNSASVSRMNEFGVSDTASIFYDYTEPSDDATLKAILVGNNFIDNFSSESLNYSYPWHESFTFYYPEITGLPTFPNTTVTYENNGSSYVNIHVLAEDKTHFNTYSVLFTHLTTAIEEHNHQEISVFPNPADAFINILSASGYELVIRDISGRTLIHQIINTDGLKLDISGFKPGIYTAEFIKNQTRSMVTIIQVID